MILANKAEPCITDALRRLDTMEAEVTAWEATFLNEALKGFTWTEGRRRILAQMVETYLQEDSLAAEIRGQICLL